MAGLQGVTTSVPLAGLNYVDPIDNMGPQYALELSNLVSDGNVLKVRNGYASLATAGGSSPVSYLGNLSLSDGTDKLVGGIGTALYSFSSGGASALSGGAVSSSDIVGDTFGQRLFLCNGIDDVKVYDGSTVSTSTFSGVTLANLINVSSYKERIYFVEKGTLKFWYGNTQAVGASALTSFNTQYFMKKGGYLLFAGSYTNQTAQTSQDLFFACSSEGELLFYQGSSPADTTTPWGVIARFEIGKPLGLQSFIRVNNDIWILTRQGIVPISVLFSGGLEAAINSVGKLINPLISQYSENMPFSNKWHGLHLASKRRVYINIPTSGLESFILVYATDTQSWTIYNLYSSGDCNSIASSNESIYYGGANGTVYTGETGYSDKGNAITFNLRSAFTFYGSRGNYKAFKDIRPLMRTKSGVSLNLGLDTDFQRAVSLATITTSTGVYIPWGSPWGSAWSSGIEYVFNRYATQGQGHSAAIRLSGSILDAPLELFAIEVRFDLGGQT